jgi:hypothetical protein
MLWHQDKRENMLPAVKYLLPPSFPG